MIITLPMPAAAWLTQHYKVAQKESYYRIIIISY